MTASAPTRRSCRRPAWWGVSSTSPGSALSRVQLLIDRNAAAGALVERTRVAGLVVGDADDRLLRMEYVSNLEDVEVGDTVLTSGSDGIYPKGFVIGDVSPRAAGARAVSDHPRAPPHQVR